jgi:hypothetical protein
MQNITSEIKKIKRTQLTNNTQRVARAILSAGGKWVSRTKMNNVPSAAARVRDLRKVQFGAFNVECKTSTALGRKTKTRTYYYRIDPENVTNDQLVKLFKI